MQINIYVNFDQWNVLKGKFAIFSNFVNLREINSYETRKSYFDIKTCKK